MYTTQQRIEKIESDQRRRQALYRANCFIAEVIQSHQHRLGLTVNQDQLTPASRVLEQLRADLLYRKLQ